MKIQVYIFSLLLLTATFAVDISETGGKKSVATPITKPVNSMNVTGSVISIDIIGNTVTIESGRKKKNQWVFSIPMSAKIMQGKKIIALRDISLGAKISVRYTKNGDTLSASSIKLLPNKK